MISVSFRVYGSNHADLCEKAVKQLVAFTGLDPHRFDPRTQDSVPWTMDVCADTTQVVGMVSLWRGDVRAEL